MRTGVSEDRQFRVEARVIWPLSASPLSFHALIPDMETEDKRFENKRKGLGAA